MKVCLCVCMHAGRDTTSSGRRQLQGKTTHRARQRAKGVNLHPKISHGRSCHWPCLEKRVRQSQLAFVAFPFAAAAERRCPCLSFRPRRSSRFACAALPFSCSSIPHLSCRFLLQHTYHTLVIHACFRDLANPKLHFQRPFSSCEKLRGRVNTTSSCAVRLPYRHRGPSLRIRRVGSLPFEANTTA